MKFYEFRNRANSKAIGAHTGTIKNPNGDGYIVGVISMRMDLLDPYDKEAMENYINEYGTSVTNG